MEKKEMNEVMRQRYPNLGEAFAELGSNFYWIFDVLDSLECGVGRRMKGSNCEDSYIDEKLDTLQTAVKCIVWDVNVFRSRQDEEKGCARNLSGVNIQKV